MPGSSSHRDVDRADVAAFDVAGERVEVLRTLYRVMTFPRHSHDTYTLGVGLRGVGSIWCRGASHARRRGDIVVIPPGEVHTGGIGPHSDVLSYFAAHVPVSLFEQCAESEGVAPGRLEFRVPVLQDTLVERALLTLERRSLPPLGTTREQRPSSAPLAGITPQEALTLAIAAVVRHHGGRRSSAAMHDDPMAVRTAKQVMQACFADSSKTSLDALAAQAGITSFHLIRTFTRSTGVSPHQYLLQVRVERARVLLASGEAPSVVAALTGFVDQSHLTGHFKRYVGTTPGNYQRGMRA
jgi:AraC-like DNA-binding protein